MQFENYMDNITPDEALCLKKQVVRYLHLRSIPTCKKILLQLILKMFSWTLVMTQRGSDLYKDYSESQKYIEKGLITEEENTYLKVGLFNKMEY